MSETEPKKVFCKDCVHRVIYPNAGPVNICAKASYKEPDETDPVYGEQWNLVPIACEDKNHDFACTDFEPPAKPSWWKRLWRTL